MQGGRRRPFLRYPGWGGDAITLTGPGGPVEQPVATRYRINHAVALLQAVREGAGISFQPSWMVKDLLARKELVRLLPRWSGPAQTAFLVYPRQRRQAMRVQVMKDLLIREIQGM